MTTNVSSTSNSDWAGRYYHIDQVLNAGGPRTDPQFVAGDEASMTLNLTSSNNYVFAS